jgi:hypothetical protein
MAHQFHHLECIVTCTARGVDVGAAVSQQQDHGVMAFRCHGHRLGCAAVLAPLGLGARAVFNQQLDNFLVANG